jgi:hypothetical protein
MWYVDFDRVVGGVPIWRGGVTARIKLDKLVMFGVDTYPGVAADTTPVLDATTAIAAAELDGPASLADHRDESATLQLLPMDTRTGVELRLVWEVRSRTAAPLGKWVSHVDARTGQLLNVYNEIRFFDGTLSATHDTRTVDGNMSTTGVPLAYLTGDESGTTATTDLDGNFSIDLGESWATTLRGSYVSVRNQAGSNGALDFSDAAPVWTDEDATLAEIDTYLFVHDVRAWGLDIAPDVAMSTDNLRANVNLSETCNAYYDGDVNFYEEGDGCNNTGRIADVIYHEWGHGFHYYSAVTGVVDGSLSEGTGDVTAMLQTLDPEIAPYFETNGNAIRELETNYVYPDDITGEVHQDGLIWAGAIWDLFGNLADTYGETRAVKGTAWRLTSTLFAQALTGGPTIEESYDEVIAADDDDGDLSNGTPHMCDIIDAFGQHGLGPLGGDGSVMGIDHDALGNQPAGSDIDFAGSVTNMSPTCVSFTVDTVDLVYSTDDGDTWTELPLDVTGDAFDGVLSGVPAGTVVEYYLHASATDGTEVSLPAGGDIAPYTFYVGGVEEIYCEPFDDDGGYTHELLDGRDQEGADDWIFDVPAGYADDPTEAFTGRKVWGNDLGGGNYNGEYQSSITNRLTSVPIDVTGESRVLVQYRRWLNAEDGVYDHATVYVNDAAVWTNHASNARIGDEHTQDTTWVLHSLLVQPDADSIQIGWEIDSDEGLELGGWNIDDVCVYRVVDDAPSALSIDDFAATDDRAENVGLSWTQPAGATATHAVVVRRDDRFPEDRTDGDVVYTSDTVTPGAHVDATDDSNGGYYAVFAGADDTWLTGAVEGHNADRGSTKDGGLLVGDDGKVVLSGNCGCSTGTGAGGGFEAVFAAAAALAAARRRQR